MSRISIQQGFIEEYRDFLGVLAQTICDRISNDEGVQALKQIQDKEYLLGRVKQIIEAVYQVKDQQKNTNYLQQIQQQRRFIIEQGNEINKLSRKLAADGSQSSYQVQASMQSSRKQLERQNIQLQKQLIQVDQQNKLRVRQFSQTMKIMERQQQNQKANFSNQLSTAIESIKLWQKKYKGLYQQKLTLQASLEQQIQKCIHEQMKVRELSQVKEELQVKVQKATKSNKSLKEQNDILGEKVTRLEKGSERVEQQMKTYQEQLRLIKRLNEELSVNHSSPCQLQPTSQMMSNLRRLQQEQSRSQLHQKNKKILQLQKKLQRLKSTKHEIEVQYHQQRLNWERVKLQLQQQLSQTRMKGQRQTRIAKQEWIKEREHLVKMKESEKSNTGELVRLKYQTRISQLQNTIQQMEQSTLKFKTHEKELENFIKGKQLHHSQTVTELQRKVQQLKAYGKQLQKGIKANNVSSHDFVKQYSIKVETCEEETAHYRKENQKLEREAQALKKQLEKVNFTLLTQRNTSKTAMTQRKLNQYSRQDFQQYIKTISELKQTIVLLQSQHKFVSKQLQVSSQHVQELKITNGKLQDKNGKQRQQVDKVEKQLNCMRQEVTQIQAAHHEELSQVYKTHQGRLQSQKRNLVSHYEQLVRNREQRLQQSRNSTNLLQTQLTINNLRNTVDSMREKALSQQSKMSTLSQNAKQIGQQLRQRVSEIQELKDKLAKSHKQLFLAKNQKTQLQKEAKEKLRHNQTVFREFKFEVDAYLRKQLSQLREIGKVVVRMASQIKTWWMEMKEKFTVQLYALMFKYQTSNAQTIKQVKSHYEHQVVFNHKIQVEQLKQQFNHKVKQIQIQNMAEIASRQFQYKQLYKEFKSLKITKQRIQATLVERGEQARKAKDQMNLIRQVNEKMSEKAVKLQKTVIQNQRQIKVLCQQNMQISSKVSQMQQSYQDKLQKCRQKYIQQNQKLFDKYQKQFDKLIGMNTKAKNVTPKSVMFSTVAPTKQFQKAEIHPETVQKHTKLENIRREILLQRKKLEVLDSTKTKLPTKIPKQYSSTSNLNSSKYY